MKKVRIVAIIIALATATATLSTLIIASINYEDAYLPEMLIWEDMPMNTNKNFQYFSFYCGDYRDGALDEILDLNCSNVVFMSSDGYAMRDSLLKCRQHNVKAMVDWDNGVSVNSNYCPDLLEEFDDVIYGFKFDEPWWNNKSMESFHYYTRTLRQDYPDKEVYAVLALGEFASVPKFLLDMIAASGDFPTDKAPEGYYKYCTILAFDFYCAWEAYSKLYLQYFAELKALCTEGQRIWFVPKGFYADSSFNTFVENHKVPKGDEMITVLKEHYKLALTEPLVEGMVIFAYKDGSRSDWGIAVENFVLEDSPHYREEVKLYYQQVGRAIIHNADFKIVRTDL